MPVERYIQLFLANCEADRSESFTSTRNYEGLCVRACVRARVVIDCELIVRRIPIESWNHWNK